MIDLGAAFTYSSVWSDYWTNPKLNGSGGWHAVRGGGANEWLETDMPGDDLYQVSHLIW